jgi:hypothetical protein
LGCQSKLAKRSRKVGDLPREIRFLREGCELIGAGTVINPIVKIVTTVAILAAVGFFIVKPILDTTEEVSRQTSDSIRQAQESSRELSAGINLDISRSRTHSFIQSLASTWPAAARAARACMHSAGQALPALQQCERFSERIVHQVQSNRNFALSYANSLSAQGRSADADRVIACVKDASFATAAMRRCRNLADQLLFG